MSDYMHHDLQRRRGYELHGNPDRGTGWGGIIAAAAALLLILALVLFGGVLGSGPGEIDPATVTTPGAAVPDTGSAGAVAPAQNPAR